MHAHDGHADVFVLAVGNGQGDLANAWILEDVLDSFALRLRAVAEIPGEIRLGDRRTAAVKHDRLASHDRRGQRRDPGLERCRCRSTSSGVTRATSHDRPASPRKWMLLIGVASSLLNTLTRMASSVIGSVAGPPQT